MDRHAAGGSVTEEVALVWRVGLGHDTHRLAAGGPLRLGGVEIPYDKHLVGHSDADVLLHALTDALLGAAALGDIGEMFPDTDPAHRGRDSGEMLVRALDRVRQAGWQVANVDCIVFAQRPKLLDHKPRMRQRLAELLGLPLDAVGLKAKTGELVGPVGREEALMAEVVVLLQRAVAATLPGERMPGDPTIVEAPPAAAARASPRSSAP